MPVKYLVIMKREADGSWKVHHSINNSNNPPPGMPGSAGRPQCGTRAGPMLTLIIDVLVTSGLLYALATALPGVRLKSFSTALTVVLVYGLLNYFLFWLIALIAFIPMLLSFGLFGLVINAFLLWMTDKLIDDFEIDSVRMTLLMAVLLTVGKVVPRAIL